MTAPLEEVEGELSADAAADACNASVAKRVRGWREVPVMRMDGGIDEDLRGFIRGGVSGTRFKARDCSCARRWRQRRVYCGRAAHVEGGRAHKK